MENQMNNIIEGSQYHYEEFCKELEKDINTSLKEKGYTWTAERIFIEYREKYSKGILVSATVGEIIEQFKDRLSKI